MLVRDRLPNKNRTPQRSRQGTRGLKASPPRVELCGVGTRVTTAPHFVPRLAVADHHAYAVALDVHWWFHVKVRRDDLDHLAILAGTATPEMTTLQRTARAVFVRVNHGSVQKPISPRPGLSLLSMPVVHRASLSP